jgi:hypothetical protein
VCSVGIPPGVSEVSDALEGIVVLLRDLVHVVALSALVDVAAVELAVEGHLHALTVIRQGMAE